MAFLICVLRERTARRERRGDKVLGYNLEKGLSIYMSVCCATEVLYLHGNNSEPMRVQSTFWAIRFAGIEARREAIHVWQVP
jgi:hypothetical protein